ILDGQRRLADDQDFQPIETERPKVRIMTVHASKGLEFPVVFLAGGFTEKRNQECLTYHKEDHVVFDLAPDDEAKERAKQEGIAEQARPPHWALAAGNVQVNGPLVNQGKACGPAAPAPTPAMEETGPADVGQPQAGILPPPQRWSAGAQEGADVKAQ